MFYYFGSKTMLAKYYPTPMYDNIIEPFAGSAAYSLYHMLRNSKIRCTLIENDKRVYETWIKLLSMSEDDILHYSVPAIGEKTSDFLIMTCAASNAIAKCKTLKFTERLAKVFEIQKKRLIKTLHLKSRIEVLYGDYSESPNINATWFIDPPYQVTGSVNKNTVFPNGNGYGKNSNADSIDYNLLSQWVKERRGQTIVCEKFGANWLSFKNLKNGKTSLGTLYKEVFWTQENIKDGFKLAEEVQK